MVEFLAQVCFAMAFFFLGRLYQLRRMQKQLERDAAELQAQFDTAIMEAMQVVQKYKTVKQPKVQTANIKRSTKSVAKPAAKRPVGQPAGSKNKTTKK